MNDLPAPESPRSRIESFSVSGFRSLAEFRIEHLPQVAVLIGANGSGKSNIIRFFEMLSWMLKSGRLGLFVGKHGGGSDQLFGGSRTTPRMDAEIRMTTPAGNNDYRFALAHAGLDELIFIEERFRFSKAGSVNPAPWQRLRPGGREARILDAHLPDRFPEVNRTTARTIVRLLRGCTHFQFHDTSDTSPMKRKWDAEDDAVLRSHGGNRAPVLHRLERRDRNRHRLIETRISRILPDFHTFAHREEYGKVALRWTSKATGQEIGAHLTSDGSLRLFALVALLNLPAESLPSVIFLDEPELGLHPAAVELVAETILSLGVERQVVVATQSPEFVSAFGLDEIIVLDSVEGRTEPRVLNPADHEHTVWLRQGLAAGDLWLRNILGGRP